MLYAFGVAGRRPVPLNRTRAERRRQRIGPMAMGLDRPPGRRILGLPEPTPNPEIPMLEIRARESDTVLFRSPPKPWPAADLAGRVLTGADLAGADLRDADCGGRISARRGSPGPISEAPTSKAPT